MEKRRLLLDEPPLLLLPTLAALIGINEAIILQQINYWIQASKNIQDGFQWTYNSYKEWQKQFPFFSKETLGRTIRHLEQMGLLITSVGNQKKFDRTKWYRIDYEALAKIADSMTSKYNHGDSKMNDDDVKLTPGNDTGHDVKLTSPIPNKTTSKTTSDNIPSKKEPRAPKLSSRPIFAEVQKYLGYPEKTDKDPIPNYGKEAKAIDTMLKRNYTEDEILAFWKKKVDARGGVFVSMVWVNEDIGGKIPAPKQAALNLPDEDELAAAAKQRGLVNA
jgi:hypothetical protein